jgi:hypothetical protein
MVNAAQFHARTDHVFVAKASESAVVDR